jgi:RNA polymerase sigma-70 factor (ECF subfamily)
MNIEQEKELVTQAKSEPQAFGSLYDAYYGDIYSYALKRTASVDVSLDITSNTFFNALKNINKFQWRSVPFSAWLYRIAANEITNYFRSNGHHEISLDCLVDFDIASEEQAESIADLEKQSDFLAVHAVVSLLPLKYREVVMLRYFDDLQLSEISERLAKSEGTVKSLLHRGLEKLRILVKKDATFDRPAPF